MRAPFLAATVVVFCTALPASASVLTIGGSYARSCYMAAEDESATFRDLENCDRALTDEALSTADVAATHVNRGIVRMLRSDFRSAQEDFEAAIQMDPQQSEAWLNMAILRFRQGDSAGSLRMFDKAIDLGTSRPEIAYFGRGLANEDSGNIKAAYLDLKKAASLKPKWAEPARELARYQVRRP